MMQRAVATYASRAAEKARRHGLVAARLQVFMTTRHFGAGPHRDAALTCTLPYPASDTIALAGAARELAARMWKPGYSYKKAGVVLLDLRPDRPEQAHLFHAPDPRRRALMAALDSVNARYGAGTLAIASSAAGDGARSRRAARGVADAAGASQPTLHDRVGRTLRCAVTGLLRSERVVLPLDPVHVPLAKRAQGHAYPKRAALLDFYLVWGVLPHAASRRLSTKTKTQGTSLRSALRPRRQHEPTKE